MPSLSSTGNRSERSLCTASVIAFSLGADHRLLALWAAACAEHVLHFFESEQPLDQRPRQAIEAIREWTRGELKVMESPAARGHAMGAARLLSGAGRHAAYAAGQAGDFRSVVPLDHAGRERSLTSRLAFRSAKCLLKSICPGWTSR